MKPPAPTVAFFVPGSSVAQPRQRHRVVSGKRAKPFVQNYTPAVHPVNAFKSSIVCRFNLSRPVGWPDADADGWVYSLVVHDVRLKAKSRKIPFELSPCGTKPDGDNVLKAIKDAITDARGWRDDCRVWDERIVKLCTSAAARVGVHVLIAARREDDNDLPTTVPPLTL